MANEFVRYFSSSFQPFVWVLSGPVLLHHTARPCKEMEDVLRKKKPMNVEKAEKAAVRGVSAAAYFTSGQGTPCGGRSCFGGEDAPCGAVHSQLRSQGEPQTMANSRTLRRRRFIS